MWRLIALLLLPATAFAAGNPNYYDALPSTTASSITSGSNINAGNVSATNLDVSNLTRLTTLELNNSTSTSVPSLTEVLYTRVATDGQMQVDGALGLVYDNGSNRVTVGTPTGATATFGDTLRVSGTQTITGALTAATISATGLSASGNFDVTGTTKTTGLVTAAGGISDTGNLSVTGNLDVTATTSLKILSVSGTTQVSITNVGGLYLEAPQPQVIQNRPGLTNGVWVTSVNNGGGVGSYALSVSQSSPVFKCDSNGCIIGKNINTGSNTVAGLQVSSSLSVTGAVSFTGLSTGTATSNLCVTSAGLVVSTTSLSGCLGVSDPKVKKDIALLPYGLKEILAIDPVVYKDVREGYYKGEQVGLLAYSVDRGGKRFRGLDYVMPELVDNNAPKWGKEPIKAVIYERLSVVLVKAVQEQQAEIEDLRAAVDELRKAKGLSPKYSQTFWQWVTGQ